MALSPLVALFATLSTLTSVSAAATSTVSAVGPGPTLGWGFHWIRDVQTDTYLQGSPPESESQGVLASGDDAGQFLIVSGGLVQLTSKAPSYTHTVVDTTTGAFMFVDGDVIPPASGIFSFASLDKALNWKSPDDGTLYTSFMVCDGQVYVALPHLTFADSCAETVLNSLETRLVL